MPRTDDGGWLLDDGPEDWERWFEPSATPPQDLVDRLNELAAGGDEEAVAALEHLERIFGALPVG